MNLNGTLYQVTLPYACFGITVSNNRVISAAPIGKWMIGKRFMIVCEWIDSKRGTLKEV